MPEWLLLLNPLLASTSAALRRSTGMRWMLWLYAAEVNSPRNRRSPTTSPASLKVFTPT